MAAILDLAVFFPILISANCDFSLSVLLKPISNFRINLVPVTYLILITYFLLFVFLLKLLCFESPPLRLIYSSCTLTL